MRTLLSAVLSLGLLGCLAVPELNPPACRHESGDCSAEAVRSRVLERFKDLNVQEVLACSSKPSMFCNSGIPDEEACLVDLGGDAPSADGEQAEKSSVTPLLVRTMLGDDAPNYRRTIRRERSGPYGPGEESVYANSQRNRAVLYFAEVRCADISEIT
jgi:hypothetical protein